MRITGRQLRRIIQEEVARMINEEDAGGAPAVPREVSDDLVELLQVNMANAKFAGPAVQGGAKFTYTVSDNTKTGSVVPPPYAQPVSVGGYALGRSFTASSGGISIQVSGPGGVSGLSERDINGDLADLITVHRSALTAALASAPAYLSGSIIVKPQGAAYNVSDVDYQMGKIGMTQPSVSNPPVSVSKISVPRR